MNIIKVNPFLQGKSFTNLIDDVFNRSISDMVGTDYAVTTPSVNVTEDHDNYVLEVAAPGLEKSDFNITVEKDQLIISVNKDEKKEDKEEGKWTRKEFNYLSFRRTFHITDAIETNKIEASYNNGILNLILPKKEEVKEKAPTTIEIK